jgi:serine/threonine protein kinase
MGYFTHKVSDHAHHFMVLERIEDGLSVIQKLTLSSTVVESDIALVIETILKTLDYVHSAGAAHGDIRPENIILGRYASLDSLKLVGFAGEDKFIRRYGSL